MEKANKEKPTTVRNVPQSEADLIDVARSAAAKWKTAANITLIWTTANDFESTVDAFENSFVARADAKGERATVTDELKTVNAEIDRSLQFVKNYLADKYGKTAAPAHYASFGIVKTGINYVLPKDNDNRLQSLRQLAAAIDTPDFAALKYGKAFWDALLTQFESAKAAASETDASSAQHVGEKQELKPVILQTLNSLILLLKANYPAIWREELRVWGFQKEKY